MVYKTAAYLIMLNGNKAEIVTNNLRFFPKVGSRWPAKGFSRFFTSFRAVDWFRIDTW